MASLPSEPPDGMLVVSSRPDVVRGVSEAARGLDPPATVERVLAPRGEPTTGLVIVDVGEPGVALPRLRSRFGPDARLVALLDSAWIHRFGDALAGDWYDYLFFPINFSELRLVWSRHTAPGEVRPLQLDVDEQGRIRLTVPAQVEYQRPAVERIVEAGRSLAGLDPESAFRVRVAVGEAVANAILYGAGERRETGLVHIALAADRGTLRVTVRDEGPGFDPSAVPDPTSGDGLERNSGRGLLLLRSLADDVRFSETGNQVTLIFRGDPVDRIVPWLGAYSDLTRLPFALSRIADPPEVLFDRLGEPAPGDVARRRIGRAGGVELRWTASGEDAARDRAAELLAGLLGVLVETGETRERWVEGHLRRQRVLAEVEVARDLQLRLMPDAEGFRDLAEVAARCEPALSLGGDFYYLVRLPGARLGVMLGDVSSHGPSAALIMALTLSAAAMATTDELRPGAVLERMHTRLLQALESTEMYMTLFYGILDPVRGRLAFSNAGHPYAYRVGAGDAFRLPALDPPLGMSVAAGYTECEVAWPSGTDTLLAFTDGLTGELSDPLERPESAVRRALAAGEISPRTLVERLFEEVNSDLRLDDRTAVAVRP